MSADTSAPAAATTAGDPASLRGRTAVVTGASRGIGLAIARRLDALGAQVLLAARDEQALKQVADGLTHDPVVVPSDAATPGAARALAVAAVEALGRVDVLVNNAGVSDIAPSPTLTETAVDTTLTVNVRTPLLLAAALAAHMAEHGGGSIVNVSSVLSGVGTTYGALYAASKGAVDAMTRALAAEFGPAGVRVNAVRPGITDTDMTGFMHAPGAADFYHSLVPLRRTGRPGDVADLVAFLASDAAAYITGEDITIDGGWARTGLILPPPPGS